MKVARSPASGRRRRLVVNAVPPERDTGIVAQAAIGAVIAYQWTIRPLIGAHCRFWPSCSDYTIDALRRHGAVRGGALAARRISRCNPWHEGGWDPVPEPNRPTGH